MNEEVKSCIQGKQYIDLIDYLQSLLNQTIAKPNEPEDLSVIEKFHKVVDHYKDNLKENQQAHESLKAQFQKVSSQRDKYMQRCHKAAEVARSRKDSNSSRDNKDKSEASANPEPIQKNVIAIKNIFPSQKQNLQSDQNRIPIGNSESKEQRGNFSGNLSNLSNSRNVRKQTSRSMIMEKSSINQISEHEEIIAQHLKKVSALEKQLEEKNNHIYQVQKKVKHLYQRIEKYKLNSTKMSKLQDQNKVIANQLYLTKKQLSQFHKANLQLKQQIASLQQNISQNETWLCQHAQEVQKDKKQLQKLKRQKQELTKTNKRAEQQIRQLNYYNNQLKQHSEQRNEGQIQSMKKSILREVSQRIRNLVEQNSTYVKQKQGSQRYCNQLIGKLNLCAQYIGRFIGFPPKFDGSQSFDQWYQLAYPILQKYKHSRLDYPMFDWIEKERKMTQRLAM